MRISFSLFDVNPAESCKDIPGPVVVAWLAGKIKTLYFCRHFSGIAKGSLQSVF